MPTDTRSALALRGPAFQADLSTAHTFSRLRFDRQSAAATLRASIT